MLIVVYNMLHRKIDPFLELDKEIKGNKPFMISPSCVTTAIDTSPVERSKHINVLKFRCEHRGFSIHFHTSTTGQCCSFYWELGSEPPATSLFVSKLSGKFNWKGNIKAILRASPDQELPVKKLRKKVLLTDETLPIFELKVECSLIWTACACTLVGFGSIPLFHWWWQF